ncbi:LCP family protein [Kytococcus sp. Marseille-QA3725]
MSERPDPLDQNAPPGSTAGDARSGGSTSAAGGRRRGLRGPWRWGCGLLSLLLVILLVGAGIWILALNNTLKNNIVQESLLPDEVDEDHTPDVPRNEDSDGDGKADLNVDCDDDGKPDVNLDSDYDGKPDFRLDEDGDCKADQPDPTGDGKAPDTEKAATAPATGAEGARNILLIGEDGVGAPYRSDVMILAHLNASGDEVTLIHFPRDLYVPIPGYGHNKLNAAYAFGGPQLLTSTFQGMLDVKIDDVAITDFDNFKSMTNELGGVTVDNPQDSPEFPKGQVTLETGDEALKFVRERKTLGQGDIGRGQRQMVFLQGLTKEAMSPAVARNPNRLSDMVDVGTRGVRVSGGLSVEEIRSLAFDFVRGGQGGVEYQTAPWTGPGTSPSGASIVEVDWPGMKQLGEDIRNDDL